MKHDVTKLPKWAQSLLTQKDREIEDLQRAMSVLSDAHAVLTRRNWFTLPGPKIDDEQEIRKLWLLDKDHPFAVCTLGKDDLLLVGRAKKRGLTS